MGLTGLPALVATYCCSLSLLVWMEPASEMVRAAASKLGGNGRAMTPSMGDAPDPCLVSSKPMLHRAHPTCHARKEKKRPHKTRHETLKHNAPQPKLQQRFLGLQDVVIVEGFQSLPARLGGNEAVKLTRRVIDGGGVLPRPASQQGLDVRQHDLPLFDLSD